jgi:choline transport protein
MTVVLMVAFTICFFGCGVANITGASRQVWSAARDDCFPLSKYLRAVSPRWEMPLNAVLVQGVFASVCWPFFFAYPSTC